MHYRNYFTVILSAILLLAVGHAQEPERVDKDEIIRIDTQLIDVPLAVVSSAGKPVGTLKAGNFLVYEDGKPQQIADFSTSTEPFEVALLLDTSGSARSDLPLIRRAAQAFIDSLRLGDRVAVIGYGTTRDSKQAFATSEVLTGLTDDRMVLRRAVENLQTSNGTPYYDSLVQIAEKVFARPPTDTFRGRRALVALTDGVDSTSGGDYALAKEELERVGLISFFIRLDTRDYFEENLMGDCESATRFSPAQIRRYYRGIAATGNMEKAASFCQLGEFERLAVSKRLYEMADKEIDELAKSSGGKVFPAGDLNEARLAFRSVAEEIGTKYTLGYYSSNEKRDGTFRRIKVELKGLPRGTTVRTREGYTAPSK